MSEQIKVVFASGSEERNPLLIERIQALDPALPLYVVSEFPPPQGRWIPYRIGWSFRENYARCRAAFRGKQIRWAGVLLEPRLPYRKMRLIPFLLAPLRVLAYNENLDHFMLRPRSARTIARHCLWRVNNFVRWQSHPGGHVYTFFWRLAHPAAFRRPLLYLAAWAAGVVMAVWRELVARGLWPVDGALPHKPQATGHAPQGATVVIPSRNGRDLLLRLLPEVLQQSPAEIIVVDNGSDDRTAESLREQYPSVVVEESREPLSFARAANRGIARAQFSHVCLLNNDMTIEPGFFGALFEAFRRVPDLFSATAQIFFPEGARREETGKALMSGVGDEFPIRCEEPIPGEDLSYVLYGSGGCSMFDTARLRQLGSLDEAYEPAYCEDLDLGVRAWQLGWPSVFVARARVLHQHRATTSRYFTPEQLDRMLEVNYLRFVARTIASPVVFRRLWNYAIRRLNRLSVEGRPSAIAALATARQAAQWARPIARSDERFLTLCSGEVAVFPGRPVRGHEVVLVASPYLPFPLSHGGAVRMFNLIRRTAEDCDQVLVAFAGELKTPPQELLNVCAEIVLVRHAGSHARPSTERPDVVEEFDSAAFHAAVRQTVAKWRPSIAQLEFTQLAQYAPDCAPAKTILVEHDITLDLYQQLLEQGDDWDTRRELERWIRFETQAWRQVDRVVTMSEKDRSRVTGGRAVCLPNGVDLERFRPASDAPEAARLLFIGSFNHLPNVLAVAFFLKEVWPRLEGVTLHVIAGARHRYFLDHYQDRVRIDLDQRGIEVEDFVADVRPAYQRATLVIAPLVASAGTNIKILEAMAMGKVIVSTPAGINGLDLNAGRDVIVTNTAAEMARAITDLVAHPQNRQAIEREARATVERHYDWNVTARHQQNLYKSLMD